jgi:hypothetical protein
MEHGREQQACLQLGIALGEETTNETVSGLPIRELRTPAVQI